jgi:hypothetical protein
MEELIRGYQRKIKYINDLLDDVDDIGSVRLRTKRACYTTFVVELKRCLKAEKE